MMLGQNFAGIKEGSDQSEEPIAEEDMMENARLTYDIFVQNGLSETSHTIEWLPYTHQ